MTQWLTAISTLCISILSIAVKNPSWIRFSTVATVPSISFLPLSVIFFQLSDYDFNNFAKCFTPQFLQDHYSETPLFRHVTPVWVILPKKKSVRESFNWLRVFLFWCFCTRKNHVCINNWIVQKLRKQRFYNNLTDELKDQRKVVCEFVSSKYSVQRLKVIAFSIVSFGFWIFWFTSSFVYQSASPNGWYYIINYNCNSNEHRSKTTAFYMT